MDPKEFEELLSEVETRVDRLRALYENWFRGYEKLEPQTARKDVERRIYQLRKDLPRNTGLRFRYNTLFQRYTTMTSYWHRTAKQIEEGTYRLQLQRLRRKHERQKELAEQPREKRSGESDSDLPPPRSYELSLDEQLDVKDLLDDFELDAVARAVDQPGPHSEPPPPVEKPAPRPMTTFAKPAADGARAAKAIARSTMSESSRYSEPPPSFAEEKRREDKRPDAAQPSPLAAGSLPKAPTAAGASVPKPPPPGGSLPKVPPPVPPPPASLGRPPLGSVPGMPGAPGSPITASGVRSAPSSADGSPRSMPRPPGATPSAAQAATPSAARAPTPSAARAPTPSAARAPEGGLGEQRLKSLYDEYTSARRKNNEGEVRYDALVSSIQKMLPELQKKHAGKQIDFEIVLKDGRVGLKPKAK